MPDVLLEAERLTKHFRVTKGLLFQKVTGYAKAVDGVSFAIEQGTTFGLVGESGCGKTTTARMILQLEKITAGSVRFRGLDLARMSSNGLRQYRSEVQSVFQDPYGSLNPRMRVSSIIAEPIEIHRTLPSNKVADRVGSLLEQVGLPPESAKLYPHEFSGGQRQRIAVARALATNPSLLVLDEPVSALDVSIRAQLMNLLKRLQRELGLTYLLIAHDLAVVRHMCSRIGVMYLGKIVELADCDSVYDQPMHPYTHALLSAALPSHPNEPHEEAVVVGEAPSPLSPPPGCRFHTRCPEMLPICSLQEPALITIAPAHQVACHRHTNGSHLAQSRVETIPQPIT